MSAGAIANPVGDVVFGSRGKSSPQMQRRLPRHGDRLHIKPAATPVKKLKLRFSPEFERAPGHLAGKSLERRIERVRLGEAAANLFSRKDLQWVRFAQR